MHPRELKPGGTYSPCHAGHPAGDGFLPRLPTLPLACFLAPYPPAPSRREGGFLVFLCKGLRPLHPPRAEPGGTYRSCHAGHPAWACLLPRLPTLPLACFLAPSPCPFPAGRGILSFLMQGAPPLASPGAEPGGTYSPCHAGHPAGGLASPPANPAFSLLSCPLSPFPPFPRRGRGILGFLMQGAPPLASPGAESGRHLQPFPSRTSGGVWLSSPPANPTFSLLSFLYPPAPSRREGSRVPADHGGY